MRSHRKPVYTPTTVLHSKIPREITPILNKRPMEKINQIIYNIANSVQLIVDVLLGLCFQPIYAVTAIIQGIIEIWTATDDVEETEQQPQQTITTYPSTNEGRYAEECDLPACNEEHHIGFKINQTEQEEVDKIKKQLNK